MNDFIFYAKLKKILVSMTNHFQTSKPLYQTMATCNICVERFTKLTRAPVICGKCEFECCKQCFIRFIIDPEHYLQCMGCREVFTRGDLVKHMTKSFMKKEFQMIQAEMFFEREKAFMGITQLILESKNLKLELNELAARRSNSSDRKERRELTMAMWDIEERLDEINNATALNEYSIPCVNTDCRGIISKTAGGDSDTLRCGLCKTSVCTHCQSESEEDHKCDENVIENLNAIARSSKPCPSCSVRISRIDGCSQMFCTQCFTLFDYNTLKIETGFRHNPHYLTWVENNPDRKDQVNKNVGEDPENQYLNFRGGALRNAFWQAYLHLHEDIAPDCTKENYETYRGHADILLSIYDWLQRWTYSIKSIRTSIIYDQNVNHLNRIKYLTNEYTEETFKKRIYRKCADLEYNRELMSVFFDIFRLVPSLRLIARAEDTAENLDIFSNCLPTLEHTLTTKTCVKLKEVQSKWLKPTDCEYIPVGNISANVDTDEA